MLVFYLAVLPQFLTPGAGLGWLRAEHRADTRYMHTARIERVGRYEFLFTLFTRLSLTSPPRADHGLQQLGDVSRARAFPRLRA